MARVLFLTTSSMCLEPMVSALESVKEWNHTSIKYFFDTRPAGFPFEKQMVDCVKEVQPDFCIFIGVSAGPYFVTPITIRAIRDICPIINYSTDTACPDMRPVLAQYRDCFTFTYASDGNENWPKGPKDLTGLTMIDPRFYEKVPIDKTIDVGFAGGIGYSPWRRPLADELMLLGLLTVPERDEEWGSYQKYADFMLNTKIALNMARTGSGETFHVKNRVLEAGLAKCVLLEEAGSPTWQYFTLNEDFVEYEDAKDAVTKITELLSDPARMNKLATNLHSKVTTTYNPKLFWERIFKHLDSIK